MTKNIAIFASGSGSNAENIIRYFQFDNSVQIPLIIANKQNAYVLERAKQLGVDSFVFPKADWDTGEKILEKLREYQIDFIILAGFLLKVPAALLQVYSDKIINIHPALLPKFGGKGMYGDKVHQAVVDAGEKETGITIHYVNENYDEGEIIAQIRCEVLPSDSPAQVADKVHALEYEHFPKVIEKVLNGKA